MTKQQHLSAECKTVAEALLNVRARLYQLLNNGQYPADLFSEISTVQVDGLLVAQALERLANDREPAQKRPTHLDERR